MPDQSSVSAAAVRALGASAGELHQLARRSFIKRAAVGGAVLTAGVTLPVSRLLPAGAAPWQQADVADATIARFAQTFELAAADAHELVAEQLGNRAWRELAARFAEHHREHADAIGANVLVQDEAAGGTVEANAEILTELERRIRAAADDAAVLEIALELEETLAATYYEAMGMLDEAGDARNFSLILPIEAQHAVALATALGRPADTYLFAFQGASPVDPAEIVEPPTPAPEQAPGGGEDDGSGTATTTTPT